MFRLNINEVNGQFRMVRNKYLRNLYRSHSLLRYRVKYRRPEQVAVIGEARTILVEKSLGKFI
jgi:hypothetical protein